MNQLFDKHPFGEGMEERFKELYDMKMNPREWIARFGHNILCGDMRMYIYKDKKFEQWIYEAFEALTTEGLIKLQKEFLTKQEMERIEKDMENL